MADATTPTGWSADINFPAFSRDKFIIALNANRIRKLVGWDTIGDADDYVWARVDKSEQYALELSPQTETKAYIDTKIDTTNTTSYQISMNQEIIVDGNNEMYALMYEYTMKHPVGSDALVEALMIMPSVTDPDVNDAFLYKEAMLTPQNLNPATDKKLTFLINFNGEQTRGTGAKDETTGRFKFTELGSTPEVQTFSLNNTTKTTKVTDDK